MGLIAEDIIAQVLDRCDIVETIAGYIPLKRAGRNFKANCPFHNEKTPSFVVNPEKQIFHCFGCGVGGNVISFVMKQERIEFPEAVKMMAEKVGITLPENTSQDAKTASLNQLIYKANELAAEFFHQTLVTACEDLTQQAVGYLKNRGVNLDIVKKFKLGFALENWDSLLSHLRSKDISLNVMEKAGLIVSRENREGFYDRFRNRIIFPIFDSKSRCVGFGARAMKEGLAKYVNSPETPLYTKGNHLYGFHLTKEAVREKDFAIVVEGYMDFIIPFQAGVNNIVASLGTALTVEQIRLLHRFTENIVMLFDADQAGESAMIRNLDVLIEEGMNVKVAVLSAGEDPDSFVRKFGVEEFSARISQAEPLIEYKLKSLMGKHSYKTIEGKAKISAEMLPTINKFKNAVIKYGYIKQLSETLNVPQEALLTEIQKIPQFLAKQEATETKTAFVRTSKMAERNLLKLVLEQEEFIPLIKEEISLSDFCDEHIRDIVARIFVLMEEGKSVTVPNLMNCLNENSMAVQVIAQLMASEEEGFDIANKEKMFRDYINRIKTDKLKAQRQHLLSQIKGAEVAGNGEQLSELTKEFNQLIKG